MNHHFVYHYTFRCDWKTNPTYRYKKKTLSLINQWCAIPRPGLKVWGGAGGVVFYFLRRAPPPLSPGKSTLALCTYLTSTRDEQLALLLSPTEWDFKPSWHRRYRILLIFIFFRLPVGYYFTQSVKGDHLHQLTLEVIKSIEEAGFQVVRLVADNHASNKKMFTMLGNGRMMPVVP